MTTKNTLWKILTVALILLSFTFIFVMGSERSYQMGIRDGMEAGHNDIINMIELSESIPLRIPNNNTGINENISWIPIKSIVTKATQ